MIKLVFLLLAEVQDTILIKSASRKQKGKFCPSGTRLGNQRLTPWMYFFQFFNEHCVKSWEFRNRAQKDATVDPGKGWSSITTLLTLSHVHIHKHI